MSEPIDSYLRRWTNSELLVAYQRTTGEAGDVEADRILAEIERRDLDL